MWLHNCLYCSAALGLQTNLRKRAKGQLCVDGNHRFVEICKMFVTVSSLSQLLPWSHEYTHMHYRVDILACYLITNVASSIWCYQAESSVLPFRHMLNGLLTSCTLLLGGFVTHHDLRTLVYFRFTYISSLIQTFIHPCMLHDLQLTTYSHIPSFFSYH